jgi:hypothetical protein
MREEDSTTNNTTGSETEKVELVREDIFWPEGRWSFRRGDLVWSRIAGRQKYYEVNREESHFKTAEEAMVAWEGSKHSSAR